MTGSRLRGGVPGIGVMVVAAIAAACAHQQAAPAETVRAFANAAERGDWDGAYALMSEDYRRRTPLPAFRADCEAERKTIAADGGRLARDPVRRTQALVRTQQGRDVAMVLEAGVWKLDEQPIAPFGQQSPRAALRTFLRAIELRRYDVLLRLVPVRLRARMTLEALRIYWEGPGSDGHRRVLQPLREGQDGPIIELGGEAHMPYGTKREDEGEVRFLFEEGVWKIDDV